jgi:hypothetical protein
LLFIINEGFTYGWKRWWFDCFDDLWLCRICSINSSLERNLKLQWQIYGWLFIEVESICRTVSHWKHPGIVHDVEYECCWFCWEFKYARDERRRKPAAVVVGSKRGCKGLDDRYGSMKDEDIAWGFNGSVHFLLVFNCESDERLVDLSVLDNDVDEDFVTSDVIMGGAEFDIGEDGQSFPILEHVWARRANGLWLESYYYKRNYSF